MSTQVALRHIEAKFRHLGAAKEGVEQARSIDTDQRRTGDGNEHPGPS